MQSTRTRMAVLITLMQRSLLPKENTHWCKSCLIQGLWEHSCCAGKQGDLDDTTKVCHTGQMQEIRRYITQLLKMFSASVASVPSMEWRTTIWAYLSAFCPANASGSRMGLCWWRLRGRKKRRVTYRNKTWNAREWDDCNELDRSSASIWKWLVRPPRKR